MRSTLIGLALTCAVVGCSETPTEPVDETVPIVLALEGVVIGNGAPVPGATVAAHLGEAKQGNPGGCDGDGWIIQGSWSLTADDEGEITADLLNADGGGQAGAVALDGCLLLFTSMPGAPDVSSPLHVPVHAIWGEADTLRVTLDITHLM